MATTMTMAAVACQQRPRRRVGASAALRRCRGAGSCTVYTHDDHHYHPCTVTRQAHSDWPWHAASPSLPPLPLSSSSSSQEQPRQPQQHPCVASPPSPDSVDDADVGALQLRYDGYSTPRMRALKRCVLDVAASQAQLREAADALECELRDMHARLGHCVTGQIGATGTPADAAASTHTVVCLRDVDHVRYVLGLAYRRLGNFARAERVHLDIIAHNPHNLDTLESLLEMYVGLDDTPKLRMLLDQLAMAHEEPAGLPTSNADVPSRVNITPKDDDGDSSVKDKDNDSIRSSSSSSGTRDGDDDATHSTARDAVTRTMALSQTPVEVVMQLLSSLLLEATARQCQEHGEGATSRYVADALAQLTPHLGANYTSQLLHTLLRQLDEQLFAVRYDATGATDEQRQLMLSVIVGTLKTLLARVTSTTVAQPLPFRFVALAALHSALRTAARLRESGRVAEQLMQLYREHSALHRARMQGTQQRSSDDDAAARLSTAATARPTYTTTAATAAGAQSAKKTATLRSIIDHRSACDTTLHEKQQRPRHSDHDKLTDTLSDTRSSKGELDSFDDAYKRVYFAYVDDMAQHAPQRAEALCQAAIREFPTSAEPWLTLALARQRRDAARAPSSTAAMHAAEQALQLAPDNLAVLALLAKMYSKANKQAEYVRIVQHYDEMQHKTNSR